MNFITIDRGYISYKKEQIIYAVALNRKTKILLEEIGPTYVNKPLNSIIDLDNENFFSVHRSKIINILKIKEINKDFSKVTLYNNHEVEVSRRRRKFLKEIICEKTLK